MSAHLSGGSLGFSFAPVLFAPFIADMGLQWSPLIMIPGLLALSITLRHVPPMTCRPRTSARRGDAASGRGAACAALFHDRAADRDLVWFHDVCAGAADANRASRSPRRARPCRSICLPAASAGLSAGRCPIASARGESSSGRWSRRCRSWRVAPRLPPGFTAMLAIGGLLLQSTLPISVTFAQTFVKGGAATVSSLMMGFAWGMGSLFVPLIGAGADRFGIERTWRCWRSSRCLRPSSRGACPTAARITSSRRSIPFRDRPPSAADSRSWYDRPGALPSSGVSFRSVLAA